MLSTLDSCAIDCATDVLSTDGLRWCVRISSRYGRGSPHEDACRGAHSLQLPELTSGFCMLCMLASSMASHLEIGIGDVQFTPAMHLQRIRFEYDLDPGKNWDVGTVYPGKIARETAERHTTCRVQRADDRSSV